MHSAGLCCTVDAAAVSREGGSAPIVHAHAAVYGNCCCRLRHDMHRWPSMQTWSSQTPFSVTWLQLVHLVRSLRAAGHFTAVAVTKPFEFEGQRKLEAAERLLAALEEAAHLVVVVEQVGCSTPACSC